jgi:hypothetical protein
MKPHLAASLGPPTPPLPALPSGRRPTRPRWHSRLVGRLIFHCRHSRLVAALCLLLAGAAAPAPRDAAAAAPVPPAAPAGQAAPGSTTPGAAMPGVTPADSPAAGANTSAAPNAPTKSVAPASSSAPVISAAPAASNAPAGTAATTSLPAAPVNLDFEDGDLRLMPPGWSMTTDSERDGFGAELTDEQPYHGALCALVHTVAFRHRPGSGTLIQLFDATAYRGQRVRFRAAVRVEAGTATRAQLFLAVQRPGGEPGFFDNMADRPIGAATWQVFDVDGDVAPDATRIGIGMTVNGDGRAWIDAGSFAVLGPAGAGEAPPRPLDKRSLANLAALARLVGYVRYFHPSDQAAATDWGRFTAAAVALVDPPPPAIGAIGATGATGAPDRPPAAMDKAPQAAAPAAGDQAHQAAAPTATDKSQDPSRGPSQGQMAIGMAAPRAPRDAAELAAVLGRVFAPIAPTLRVFATGARPPAADLGVPAGASLESLRQVWWNHAGLGAEERPSLFASARQRSEPGQPAGGGLDPRQPFAADLGGGVSCLLPLALYADAAGSLPQTAYGAPAGTEPSLADRNGRLAIVMLAWNVLQHFDPGLAAADRRWQDALAVALRAAAAGSGGESLFAALRHMVAATGDGQATLAVAGDPRTQALPVRWDEVEGRLVITAVATGVADLHPGDAVVAIDGKPADAVLRAAEAEVAAATPQGRRWRALSRLLLGAAGEPLRLEIQPAGGPAGAGRHAARRQVTLQHSIASRDADRAFAHAEALREPTPGVLVADLARLSDADLTAALPRLAQASGVVFDLRGYVRSPERLLAHLIVVPTDTGRELVPHWRRPDRQEVAYTPAAMHVEPQAPLIRSRLAFISSPRDIGAAESFVATIAEFHLGAIVGAPTAGATGTVDSSPLPAGLTLVWTATRPAAPSGGVPPPPPGTAVAPTVPAAPTRQGLAAGRDEVLERALALVGAPASPTARP